jgi:hypothetical protein
MTHTHAPRDASALAGTIRYATLPQVTYLEGLLTQYGLFSGHYDRLWKLLEMHRLWLETKDTEDRDGSPLEFTVASRTIDWVKRQVAKDKLTPAAVESKPGSAEPSIPAGRYAVQSLTGAQDLDFFQVDRPGSGKWAGRTFIKRIIGGHPDTAVRGATAVQALAAIERAGWLQAGQLYGQTIGECSRCHTHLTDEESRSRGYGPHCWAQVTQ